MSALVIVVAVSRESVQWPLLWLAAGFVAYLSAAFGAFPRTGVLFPIVGPSVTLLVTLVIAYGVRRHVGAAASSKRSAGTA